MSILKSKILQLGRSNKEEKRITSRKTWERECDQGQKSTPDMIFKEKINMPRNPTGRRKEISFRYSLLEKIIRLHERDKNGKDKHRDYQSSFISSIFDYFLKTIKFQSVYSKSESSFRQNEQSCRPISLLKAIESLIDTITSYSYNLQLSHWRAHLHRAAFTVRQIKIKLGSNNLWDHGLEPYPNLTSHI
ncbi:hypothetical protein HZH68_015511 [Vespula germanica]|uniref:Uncharacterized protein n=1 Tax=Vespula germanica TaxID=30212 RepID=A0A834MRE9_VESGE|nr:hypothetical protein HZH68_015511 [Vespula germanica]